MKVLIISHGYAPALNARAFRWTAIAEHWASLGHEVDVITVRSQGSSGGGTVNRVRVHRVGMYLDRLGLAARQSGHAPESTSDGSRGRLVIIAKAALFRAAKFVHGLTWKKIYWPDFAAVWVPFAAAKARQILAASPETVLISVSMPFSGHVAAILAGAGRKKFPWVADIGDPFSFSTDTPSNNTALYFRLNRKLDARVMRTADAVTVTTAPTRDEYVGRFGYPAKVTVIPPLLTATVREDVESVEQVSRRRWVYVGTLNKRIRNPDRLLSVFAAIVQSGRMPDLELHFYGETGDCKSSFALLEDVVASRIVIHGLVSRSEAIAASQQSLALINIGNSTHFQLPSKLVEYAAARRPIINFVTGPEDSSIDFLRGVPAVLTLPGELSVEHAASEAIDFLRDYLSGTPDLTPDEWFARYTVERVGNAYEQAIMFAQEKLRLDAPHKN